MTTMDDLYAEFARPRADGMSVLAHLGSSLDGRIATTTGHSSFVTGPENLRHMHRLRALADVIVVGAGTVAADDPQLTVRLCEGSSPVRVVLDPGGRLTADRRLFKELPPATIVLRERGTLPLAAAEVVTLPAVTPASVLGWLHGRGWRRVFIEGGGVTVSRFLAAGCLDQLQVCIAPVIVGSGRPAFTLPPIATMPEALRPHTRSLPMGSDMLFVCDLERRGSAG